MTMRQQQVIDILRGPDNPLLKRKLAQGRITVHVLGPQDCMVQVGSRVVLDGVTKERALEEADGQCRRLRDKGLSASVTVFE